MIAITRKPIISVMGSHEKEWEELSRPIGKLIAQHDFHLMTGGGAGVMLAVARAFCSEKERTGLSIGIIPTLEYKPGLIASEEFPNPYIEIPIITQLDQKASTDAVPYSRNRVNVLTGHALIFLPGDHGTRNEVALALHYNKPMVLFGPSTAFSKFPEAATRCEDIEEVRVFLEQTLAQIKRSESLDL